MIIKSMARKDASFHQLVAYFHKEEGRGEDLRKGDTALSFARNLYFGSDNPDAAIKAFEANYQYLPKRRNGNALYHEIIVLEQEAGVAQSRQAEILLDLAERYCAQRCPDQLVYGRIHQGGETLKPAQKAKTTAQKPKGDYQHIHLMISANAVRSKRRVRLPKARFAEIQRELEAYKLENFPELSQLKLYNRDANDRTNAKTRNREQEAVARTGLPSKKQMMAERIGAHIAAAQSVDDLTRRLTSDGLELYQRGKMIGVEELVTGRRHRLKTLGAADAFQKLNARAMDATRNANLDQSRAASPASRLSDPDIPISAPAQTTPQAGRKSTPVLDTREQALLRDRAGQETNREDRRDVCRPLSDSADPRAERLLRRRALERSARDRLDGFDHERGG